MRCPLMNGAGNGARTRHLSLGKAALYQMSYSRKWCLRVDLNHRHRDFQSLALPTELRSQMAVSTGIEPAIFCVTGRRVNHYTTEPEILKLLFKYTKFSR